jgi:hypothetical protein
LESRTVDLLSGYRGLLFFATFWASPGFMALHPCNLKARDSKENVEFGRLRRCKKVAIFQSSQSGITGCLAIVLGQRVPESLIDTFVDHNFLTITSIA